MCKERCAIFKNAVEQHGKLIKEISNNTELMDNCIQVAEKLSSIYKNEGKLLICGNGGSAADAQHFAAELVGRFYKERRAFHAEALSVNGSVLTAIANDYGYDRVFTRQVEAVGRKGDMLFGISTSGSSSNIVEAFKYARGKDITTVLLTGDIGQNAAIRAYTDVLLNISEKDTPRIQEIHILIIHIICQLIEEIAS